MENDTQTSALTCSPGQPPITDLCGRARTKKRGKPHGSRAWGDITGITLHQTSVDFGTPEHRGLVNVPAHAMTFQAGEIALLNFPNLVMWHGNGLNKGDIGIEVSCRAAGIEGIFTRKAGDRGPNTFWRAKKKPNQLPLEATEIQLEATRWVVDYYVNLVKENGGKIRFIHAHRQSAASRVSDPGSKIWKGVGLWAQDKFGLSSGPDGWTVGKGHPIPTAWDQRISKVPYSWKVRGY